MTGPIERTMVGIDGSVQINERVLCVSTSACDATQNRAAARNAIGERS